MLKTITYEGPEGQTQTAAYITQGSAYALAGKRERFAQLMAKGKRSLEAYLEAFDLAITDAATEDDKRDIRESVRELCNDTTIVLRIQELKRPVLRVLKRKIEYNLQKALEQCQVAYDLAYQQGDSKGILAAIRMQAELAKLLTQEVNVNHRYGLLDDTSTEVLLAMKKELEVRQAKQKRLAGSVTVESRTVSEEGGEAASGVSDGSHPEAVPN